MSEFSQDDARRILDAIVDPAIGRTLADLKAVGSVEKTESGWTVQVRLPTPAYPDRERLAALVRSQLESQVGSNVDVAWETSTMGKNSGGKVGLRTKNVIAVGSGKGGVGKSTVSASLAFGLKSYGASVGLLDADVYGPSVPHLVGVTGKPAIVQHQGPQGPVQRIEPLEADGIKLMSIGFMVPAEQAVIWRGPMLAKALTDFVANTDWGELDYLIIDMPPGTGDVALTLSQMLGLAGAVVVCTPQQLALLDAVKAINMFQQVKIPVLGMVENMSGEMFGRGGAKQKAEELGVPFLGEVPSDPQIRIRGDAGEIGRLFDEESETRTSLRGVCENTAVEIVRNLLDSPTMPDLEIL